ncbi:DNA helicase [Tanacetum coccineum]
MIFSIEIDESSVAVASRRVPYCDMDTFPYGQANILEDGQERHTMAQDLPFVSCHKKGQVVLDFESSSILKSSADTEIESHTTAHNSSFVSGQYNQQSRVVGIQETMFWGTKATWEELGQTTVADDTGSSDASTRGVSSLYMDIGDCQWSCEHCKAKFWYGERLKGYSKDQQPHYHKCCSGGKVVLENEREPPEYIKLLFGDRNFLDHIRVYNHMFSMTSFGARVDESINNGRGPYVFKISGQIYHWISTLCPFVGDPPRFLQLYIYDTENEVANRMRHFGGTQSAGLNEHTVEGLMHLLDECNELVRLFRTARDKCNGQQIPDFKIRLYSVVGAREYDLPTSQTLGAIVFENGQNTETDYDVIIESKDGFPQRINKLHSSYMALQFPLIFVYGQPGFHTEMKLRMPGKEKRLSMNMYYMYQLHERFDSYGLLFRAGRLFQQYVVGVFAVQATGLIIQATSSNIGKIMYMYSHYLDALAICRVLGNPQYFITFTCNVNWPEIKRHMEQYPGLLPGDRADIVVRVFEQKVHDFCKYLRDTKLFGTVTGLLYTIEFQKRGLPHCHTLLWVDNKDKIQDAKDVDRYISAELPNPKTNPEGYRIVSEMMVHGPCGKADESASCMKENLCSKKFPKKFNNETYFDKNGYVYYRRRDTGVEVTRRGIDMDNSYVVPYNHQLCIVFHAHINVEYCGWSMLIKYLFKYISKGTDKTVAQITRPVGSSVEHVDRREIHVDKIQNFVDGRFICPHEACWRTLKFEIHSRYPVVQILSVHLENKQLKNDNAHRMKPRCCTSFKDIRTVNHKVYGTFRSTCDALGLLGDDKEWDTALEEAFFSSTASELRSLFAQILIFCDVLDPLKLWKKY